MYTVPMWRGWWAPLLVERGFKQIACCPVEGDKSHMLDCCWRRPDDLRELEAPGHPQRSGADVKKALREAIAAGAPRHRERLF
jgi:hypothetical protein